MKPDDPKLVALIGPHLDPGETIVHAVAGRYQTAVRRPRAFLAATDRRPVFYANKTVGCFMVSMAYQQTGGLALRKTSTGHHIAVGSGSAAIALNRVRDPDLTELERFVRAQAVSPTP